MLCTIQVRIHRHTDLIPMDIIYSDAAIYFKPDQATNAWKEAVLTITDVGYSLRMYSLRIQLARLSSRICSLDLLMVTARPNSPVDQPPRTREDLLVRLIHRAWVFSMDEVNTKLHQSSVS